MQPKDNRSYGRDGHIERPSKLESDTPRGSGNETMSGRSIGNSPTDTLDLASVLTSVGEAAYEWDLRSDEIRWSANAEQVLPVSSIGEVNTGRKFAFFLDPKNTTSRYDTVFDSTRRDHGDGVPYQIEYRFLPERSSSAQGVWLEDTGRWFSGPGNKASIAKGIVRVIDDRHARVEELKYLAANDYLTGELNRLKLMEHLAEAIDNAKAGGHSSSFIIAAVDNLSVINEAYGFDIADEVIKTVTTRLKTKVRYGDSVGRLSGNKIGVVLRNCSEEELNFAIERFTQSVNGEEISTVSGPVSITISVGAIVAPRHAQTYQDALLHCQEALEQARKKHRGSIEIYKPNSDRDRMRAMNMRLSDEIIAALNDRRMELAYQPIVDATTGKTQLYECLLRVRREDGSEISAGEFIPLTNKLGFTRLLDSRVLELVLADLREIPDIRLAINISSESASDPAWLGTLTNRFMKNREFASRLVIEITETLAIKDIEQTQHFVSTLKDLGCQVAIDDFGAGYTSFKNLKALDVDLVKIDGSFIRNLPKSAEDQVFVRTLTELAQTFERKTVAEWVNDEATANILRSWGVDYFQGNYYGSATTRKPAGMAGTEISRKSNVA